MKIKFLFFYFWISSSLFTCFAFKDGGDNTLVTNNAMELLNELNTKLNHLNDSYDNEELKNITNWSDDICSGIITDNTVSEFNNYLDEIDKFNSIDAFSGESFALRDNSYLKIVISELHFRSLIAIQHNLQIIYSKLPAKDQFSSTIVFATTNNQISETKTDILNQVIGRLAKMENSDLRIRCWIAIERMLNEIDIKNSETGDQIIQRSPVGILIAENEIIDTLRNLSENEKDTDVIEYAQKTILSIEENTSKYKKCESQIIVDDLNSLVNKRQINEEAVKWFNEAVNSTDNSAKIYNYTKAIESDSNFFAAFNNRGICFFENEDYQSAINDFQKGLEIDSSETATYSYLGCCFLKLKQYNSAIDSYSIYLITEGRDIVSHLNRGLCYHLLENYDLAIKDYSDVIKIDSTSTPAYTNRAQSYLAENDLEKAASDYKTLLQLEPDNSNNYYNLGCIYWKKQDWPKVIEILEEGLKINPNDSNINKNLPVAKSYFEKSKK